MKDCFVIMPIGSGEEYEIYLNRYENLIKPAIEGIKDGEVPVFRAVRADFISESGSITRSVIEHLYRSEAVIADLTDLNPNVFYELGVRHALRKGTVLVALAGTKIPFDLGDLKVIFYQDRVGGERKAIPSIQGFLNAILSNMPHDSPIFTTLPELSEDQKIDISELKAKFDAAKSEIDELRTKLAIAEEVNLNFRKAFSSFEEIIESKFSSARAEGKHLSEADIRTALQERQQIAVTPHFRISGTEEVPGTCFVLMPFRKEFHFIYDRIRDVLLKVNVKAIRADELSAPGLITDQIAEQIARAEFILADVTGQNPNVMYEIGIASTLGKKVVIISQEDQRLPFDIAAQRVLFYNQAYENFKKFQTDLETTIVHLRNEKVDTQHNAVTDSKKRRH